MYLPVKPAKHFHNYISIKVDVKIKCRWLAYLSNYYLISSMSTVIVFLFPLDGIMKDFEDKLSPELQILVRLYTDVALHPNTQLSLSMFTASSVS